MMKIAFVTIQLSLIGGAGRFLANYSNKFSEKGYKIYVIANKIDKNVYNFNKRIKLIEVGGELPSKLSFWFNFYRLKRRYLKVLKLIKCDIIFSNLFPTNYFCSKAKKYGYFTHIYYCHEPLRFFHDKSFYLNLPTMLKTINWFFRKIFKKYDIIGALSANKIICNSRFTKKRVKEVYGVNPFVHITGIELTQPQGKDVNFNLRERFKIKEESSILFALGLTHHMKGIKELLLIFYKIHKELPKTILLIGGWIKEENKKVIKKLMNALEILPTSIIFCGFIDNEFLDQFYSQSDLTLFTSKDEPFGLIPLESMKNGTPVIAFDEGGPAETIINGKCGYLIKNYDLDVFAQKAISLLEDKVLYADFSINAIEHVRKSLSLDKGFTNLVSIIKKIMPEF